MNTIVLAWPALVTWCAIAVYFWSALRVAKARKHYRIPPPITDGPEGFLLAFRAHQNTLEQLMMFLPSLWLAAIYFNPLFAAVLGAIWVGARIWYVVAYSSAVEKRLPPFILAIVTTVLLMVGALYGILGLLTA